tara:strand:+ start:400 stop:756 length:357 start_codon:yes stop_codon:yes gene_type:complete
MFSAQLLGSIGLFFLVHIMVWFTTNTQFMDSAIKDKSLLIAIILAIPTTLCAYFASKITYGMLEESAWAVRFIAFGTSWLIFPFLTWWLLNESMLTPKTMICTFLAICIICVQLFWRG